MFTVFTSPTHILPITSQAPTIRDELGGGAMEFRRRFTRPLRRWEINVPAAQETLDPILGLLDYAQGDTAIWFDAAATAEVVEPVLVGIGNGTITDFRLPHRHVFVSSLVVYQNSAIISAWTALGSSVIADTIRFTAAPANNVQITAKYRRKVKVVLDTESEMIVERNFRDLSDPKQSRYRARYFLQEIST